MSNVDRVLQALAEALVPLVAAQVNPRGEAKPSEHPMSLDELSTFTNLSRSTLADLAKRRQIPCYRAGKRLIFLAMYQGNFFYF